MRPDRGSSGSRSGRLLRAGLPLLAVVLALPLSAPIALAGDDPDADRLSTAFETSRSLTDPNDGDTDGDGIRDGAEDPDGDGLSNAGEQRFDLDPWRVDTDGDGRDDWHEDSNGRGPVNGLEQDRRRVPGDLTPSLARAASDRPPSYRDGCHLRAGETTPRRCAYAAVRSRTKVVVFGDSHAAQWLPALIEIGRRRGWRIISVTKSACPSASATVWSGSPKLECDSWRRKAFEHIEAMRPDLVLVTSFGRYRIWQDGAVLPQSRFADAWRGAWTRTLRRLTPIADRVALVADTPLQDEEPLTCLARHPDDVSACVTLRSRAILEGVFGAERRATVATGTTLIRSVPLVCPYDPCPVLVDRWLIDFDRGHMVATYSRRLGPGLERTLPAPFAPRDPAGARGVPRDVVARPT